MSRLHLTIDTELSSLDTDSALLTAYFGIFSGRKLVDELYLKLIPDNKRIVYDPVAMGVNKLDLRNWDGITYKEASKIVDRFIRYYVYDDSNPRIPLPIGYRLQPVGQAVDFDIKKIKSCLISPERWDEAIERIPLDTLQFAAILRDTGKIRLQSLSLESLVRHFKLDEPGYIEDLFGEDIIGKEELFHTARYDAIITYALYLKLSELL